MVRADLRAYFDTVVGGGDVTKQKPDPALPPGRVTRLGVTSAVVLEDSQAGMAAGRAAGFQVLPVRHPEDVPNVLSTAGI